MATTFLQAEWRNLIMANYTIDPHLLRPYLPCRTELDFFNGNCYVSLVGFLFANTKVRGISFPFHTNFEEVNLRFYVRSKEGDKWRRGVVFLKEIVPRRMISFIANSLYGEKYATHPMRHHCFSDSEGLHVGYEWKVNGRWNHLRVLAEAEGSIAEEGLEESFITEHYWGYTHINAGCTGLYEVEHPVWKLRKVKSFEVLCDTERLYGPSFVESLSKPPSSVFLCEGSAVQVLSGSKIVLRA